MNFALFGVFANVIVGASLFYIFHKTNHNGYIGLAIGTTIAAWLNTLLLSYTLIKRGWWRIVPWVKIRMMKIIIASIIMGAYLYLAKIFQDTIISWFDFMPFFGKEFAILVVCLLGFTIYGIAAILLKAVTISDIKSAIKK